MYVYMYACLYVSRVAFFHDPGMVLGRTLCFHFLFYVFIHYNHQVHYWNGACEKERAYNREFAPLKCSDAPLIHKQRNPAHVTYIHGKHEGTFNATMERMGGRVTRDHIKDKCFQQLLSNFSLPCPVHVEQMGGR